MVRFPVTPLIKSVRKDVGAPFEKNDGKKGSLRLVLPAPAALRVTDRDRFDDERANGARFFCEPSVLSFKTLRANDPGAAGVVLINLWQRPSVSFCETLVSASQIPLRAGNNPAI